jgi:acyl-coenzyme A synthetase/AMP-(fatty) acid ligase
MPSFLNILSQLNKQPNTIGFVNNGRSITNSDFIEQIECLAKKLLHHPARTWALCYSNSFFFLIALFATLYAKKEPILLPNNQAGTLENFRSEYHGLLTDVDGIEETLLEESTQDIVLESLQPEQSIILFTSGSTGQPKKITRKLSHLISEITVLEQVFGRNLADSHVYSTVSHQHIYGLLFYLLWPLTTGRCIIAPLLVYPENIIAAIAQEAKIVLISSPSLLNRITNAEIKKRQVTLFSSGGLLAVGTADNLKSALNTYPYEILGSTETGGVAYRQQLMCHDWRALPGVKVELELVSKALRISSPFFEHDEPFTMGDIAMIKENGRFQLLGRNDRIVKIEGKRLSLAEMEVCLRKMNEIADIYVLALENHRQYLASIVVLTASGEALLKKQGKRFLNQQLTNRAAKYFDRVLLPKKFRYVNEIPTNSQGKHILADMKNLFNDGAKEI